MSWPQTILREIWGLFVDDGSFAIAIVLWLVAIGIAQRWLTLPGYLGSIALFLGLAVILAESVLRFARRHAAKG